MAAPMEKCEIFYKNETFYEITVNVDNIKQFFGDPMRLSRCRAYYKSLLKSALGSYSDFYFIFELSEPKQMQPSHDGPRLHVHGIIKFKDVIKFLSHGLRELSRHATVQINPLRIPYWCEYMSKQQSLMHDICLPITLGGDCKKLYVETMDPPLI